MALELDVLGRADTNDNELTGATLSIVHKIGKPLTAPPAELYLVNGRQPMHVFFSFHYQRDIFRVNQVRNANKIIGHAAAGFKDYSLWEEAKTKGRPVVEKMIDDGLYGTRYTVVLIGRATANREYVDYEIRRSVERGNVLIGVRINHLTDHLGLQDPAGAIPTRLVAGGYPIHTWRGVPEDLANWLEDAARRQHRSA